MDSGTQLAQEWQTLQGNHEQHEHNVLLIKLSSLAFFLAGLAAGIHPAAITAVILLCWLQDAIYKTYQGRLVERLLQIEVALRQGTDGVPAMQLYSDWTARRPDILGLIVGYIRSACKPTVAVPYAPLLLAWAAAHALLRG